MSVSLNTPPAMSHPHLPWEPVPPWAENRTYHNGNPLYDIDDPQAPWTQHIQADREYAAGENFEAGEGLRRLVHATTDVDIGRAGPAIIGAAKNIGQVAGLGHELAGFVTNEGPFHFNPLAKAFEVVGAVEAGATIGAAAAETGGIILLEYGMHKVMDAAWSVSGPLLPGDSKTDKILNALEMSVGMTPTRGEYRPPGPTNDAEKALNEWLYGYGPDSKRGREAARDPLDFATFHANLAHEQDLFRAAEAAEKAAPVHP